MVSCSSVSNKNTYLLRCEGRVTEGSEEVKEAPGEKNHVEKKEDSTLVSFGSHSCLIHLLDLRAAIKPKGTLPH